MFWNFSRKDCLSIGRASALSNVPKKPTYTWH